MADPLARAVAALRKDKPTDALEALLEAWADAPSPAIAELVADASAIVRTSPPNLRGKTKAAIAAWTACGRAPKPEDVPALLESLADVLWRDAYARLAMIEKWRPDPRVDEAMVRLFETLPYRSTSKQFYVALLARLSRVRDPDLIERIRDARTAIPNLMSATLGDWLCNRADEMLDELDAAKPRKPPAAAKQVGDALARLAKATAPRAELEDLLDAIYEQPDDIGRRLVYADALLERGDPRGELIALQCQDSPTSEQKRRANALVKAHGKSWLGELAPILAAGWKFERGFLAEARVDSNKGTRIRPLIGHPAWSTVHTLADSAQIALHPRMRALRTLEFRPNRARNREDYATAWRELLAGTPRPIERLHYTDIDVYQSRDEQIELLGTCPALPNLRELHVGGVACYHADELFAAPICKRIDTLGFRFERYDEVPASLFARMLRDSAIKRVVVMHAEITVEIERATNTAVVSTHKRGRTTIAVAMALRRAGFQVQG